MLLRPRTNSERPEEGTQDAEDDDSLITENSQGIDDCCGTG
jgi:hypothetical protein